jgi:DNA-binding transcriptional LysR family regulator
MELGVLRVFQAVAREGSVSRAAEKLNYVQSNVTARVRQLEDDLGTRLFYRKSRGMTLTPAGQVLSGYADKLLGLAGEAERAVKEEDGRWGPLAIGSMNSVASINLPGLLTKFHSEYPQVELNLVTGKVDELIEQVLDYSLEGVFLHAPVSHPQLEEHPAFEQELVLVHAKGEPVFKDDAPSMLAFPHACCPHRVLLEKWLQEKGRILNHATEVGSMEAILGCVAAGMGISLVPREAVEISPSRDRLDTKKLPAKYSRLVIVFVRRKDVLMTRGLEAFLETIKQD